MRDWRWECAVCATTQRCLDDERAAFKAKRKHDAFYHGTHLHRASYWSAILVYLIYCLLVLAGAWALGVH